jgi:hypothetical protein
VRTSCRPRQDAAHQVFPPDERAVRADRFVTRAIKVLPLKAMQTAFVFFSEAASRPLADIDLIVLRGTSPFKLLATYSARACRLIRGRVAQVQAPSECRLASFSRTT